MFNWIYLKMSTLLQPNIQGGPGLPPFPKTKRKNRYFLCRIGSEMNFQLGEKKKNASQAI